MPNSAASSSARQPATRSIPSASSALPGGKSERRRPQRGKLLVCAPSHDRENSKRHASLVGSEFVGRPNVTSADVAKAAGVSRATVSYVLNGVDARVSEETRERVLAVARELGYVPHAFASALRAGRTSVVVIALPAWPLGPPVAEVISALVGELDRLGYTPLVHFRHWAGPDGLTKACDRVRPVGLIAPVDDLTPERVESLRANGTRAVVALAGRPPEHIPSLVFDQRLVGELAIEHLAERGHTHVLAIVPSEPELHDARRAPARGRAGGRERGSASRSPRSRATSSSPATRPPSFAFNDEYALDALDRLPAGLRAWSASTTARPPASRT